MSENSMQSALEYNEVALRILKATDSLMAAEGMHNLSTHKVAKAAGVSVGTIYLYFKDKEALLNQLVIYLFDSFERFLHSRSDTSLPLFEQYRSLWLAGWSFMQQNPNVVQNMHQYEALPTFRSMLLACTNAEDHSWNVFIKRGQEEGVLSSLPPQVLLSISVRTAWELMYVQLLREENYGDEVIEEVIQRTWKAITL